MITCTCDICGTTVNKIERFIVSFGDEKYVSEYSTYNYRPNSIFMDCCSTCREKLKKGIGNIIEEIKENYNL